MNRIYRLIFNRALGVLQVASELARPAGGAATAGSGQLAAALRTISFSMWVAMGWVGIVMPGSAQQAPPAAMAPPAGATGRIVADPDAPRNQRPTVIAAPNGTPVVNITTPSTAGVSRNVYSQFDVGTQGTILNNSRTHAQTQLGGWVQGNPWLATGTARVILNEVNGAHPSYLNGYIEVAGDRAEVIIANPAGIQVDGGGFLNASRVTLTTGAPVFAGGSLDHYRVTGGAIGVSGAGLDTSRVDYTHLIARSLQVNAGMWAQHLSVTTGVNTVDATDGAVQAGASSAPAPGFAIDVGQLGGMYAGKITLLGTEHGVGVRNAGGIGAQAGDLIVTVDGRLENTGSLQAQQNSHVSASGGVTNAGLMSAGRESSVSTSADVDNSGGTLNAMRVEINALSLRNRDGVIEQTGVQALALHAGSLSNRDGGSIGEIGEDPGEGSQTPGGEDPPDGDGGTGQPGGGGAGEIVPPSLPPVVPLADGALNIAGLLDNDGGRIVAGGGVDLATANGLNNDGGQLGLRGLTVSQGDVSNRSGALTVSGPAILNVGTFNNDAGRFNFNQSLVLGAQWLSNRGGILNHAGTDATRIRVTHAFDNTDGTLASNASALDISSGNLINERGTIQQSGTQGLALTTGRLDGNQGAIATAGALTLSAADIAHRDATLSAMQVTLSANMLDNTGGEIVAIGTAANTLTVAGTLGNTEGVLASNGHLSLAATTFTNVDGVVQQAGSGTLAIEAGTLNGQGGTLVSNGALTITGQTTDLREGTLSAQRIAIETGDLTTAGGQLTATSTEALSLQVRNTLDNTGGTIGGNGTLGITAHALHNQQGVIVAAGTSPSSVAVDTRLDNAGGTLSFNDDTIIDAGELLNAGGTLLAAERSALQVTVNGLLDNRAGGRLAAGGDLMLDTETLDNRSGAIEQAGEGDLVIEATTLLGEDGRISSQCALELRGEDIDLRRATTMASDISVMAGRLTTAEGTLAATGDGALQVQVREALDNDRGTIAANGALELDAGALSNREGVLTSAGMADTRIAVRDAWDNTDGTLATNAASLALSAGQLINERGTIQQSGTQGLTLTTGRLDGNAGTLATAGALTLSATDIAHRDATLSATQMTLTASGLDNTGGQIVATGNDANTLTVTGTLDNTRGVLASNGDLSLTATTFTNVVGVVQQAGAGTLAIETDTLNGPGGTLASNGALTIHGQTTDLRDGMTSAQRIGIDTGDLTTAGGQLTATGTEALSLQVRNTLDNTGGVIGSNGALDLAAQTLHNQQGVIVAAGVAPSMIAVDTRLDNTGGTLSFNGDTTLDASELLNAGGTVLAAETAALQVTVDGLLDNHAGGRLAASGDLVLDAATLDNRSGSIEQAGEGDLIIETATLLGEGGRISSQGALELAGEDIDLRRATTMARNIAVTAGTLTMADGTLSSTGEGALRLQVREALNNDRGTIAANGALELDAGALSNREGALTSAGTADTRITVRDALNNTDGMLASNAASLALTTRQLINERGVIQQSGTQGLALTTGRLDGNAGTIATTGSLVLTATDITHRDASLSASQVTLAASGLDNTGGQIVATGTAANTLTVTGTLDNTTGVLASNGDLLLAANTLTNVDGVVQQAGAGTLVIDANTLNGQRGTLVSNGALTITGQAADLREGTTSAQRIAIDTGELTTAGGQLAATGTEMLSLQVRNTLDNTGGMIGGNGTVELTTNAFNNADGVLQAAGAGQNRVQVAGELDNRSGTLLAAGDAQVHAGALLNQAGALQVAGALQLGVDGRLDNSAQGVIASGDDMRVVAGEVDNQAGVLGAGGAMDIVSAAGIDTTSGTIQAVDALNLSSDGLINRAGAIIGSQVHIDTRGHALDNTSGTLASTAGGVTVSSGTLDNTAGLLQSAGNLLADTNGQGLTNSQSGSAGGIVSAGRLDVRSGDLANQAGVVFAQGDATLVASAIDNTNAGSLGSAADLMVRGTSLSNTGGTVRAGGNATLSLRGELDNLAGLVAAGQTLAIAAATVDNRDTRSPAEPALGLQASRLQLDAGSVNNRQGQLIADAEGRITVTGLLDNGAGLVSSAGTLDIGADAVVNTTGTLISGGNQTLTVRVLSGDGQVLSQSDATLALQEDFVNAGEITANGTLALTTAGSVRNAGTLQAGQLDVRAVDIDNAVTGEITALGVAYLEARGALANRGLIDGAVAHIEAGIVDNLGTGRLYGDHLAIAAGELRNRAETVDGATRSATIAARLQLDLGVGTLDNTGGGLIYSGGNAAIGGALDDDLRASGTAGTVNNVSSIIDVEGALSIDTGALNNLRENVLITAEGAQAVDETVTLHLAGWQQNGGNTSSTLNTTNNYRAFQVYYLNPADILDDGIHITPDGYRIGRAVVRLTPETSSYFFAHGGLSGARGERWRVNPADGTVTIYYTLRQDGQSNPDQGGSDDPFRELTAGVTGRPFQYQTDNLAYSNAYGSCTDDCVQLITPWQYTDPDGTIIHRFNDPSSAARNEEQRIAHHTAFDDVVAPGMGADAVIRSGEGMYLTVDDLTNRYGQIAAGGDLGIVGHNGNSRVVNIGQTLYRTHYFNNTSIAYNGSTRSWSNPPVSEQIGQVGGSITSGGTLVVDVGDLSNLDEGRDAPNVQDGAALANLNTDGPGTGPAGPGTPSVSAPGQTGGLVALIATALDPGAVTRSSSTETVLGALDAMDGQMASRAAMTLPAAVATQADGPGGAVGNTDAVAGSAASGAAGSTPGTIGVAALDLQLPTSSLFTVQPNGGSYLVETDPRFADYRHWLGSDYLLNALGYSPTNLHKRLGDGYYEQKLIRDQIGQLTGRRFLTGYSNEEAQFRALMEAGAVFARQFGLRPGVALSAEQMAQLTSDIVWLVEQTVTLADGSTTTVLAPQVYLRLRPGDISENGALLAGENVHLNLRGNLVNSGDIAGRQVVSINATNIHNLQGGAISGRAVGLQATQDINVIGATVTAQDVLSVRAGGDVTVASTTQTLSGGGFHAYEQTSLNRVAGLYVTNPGGLGMLSVNAGGDITLQAAQIHNAGLSGLTQLAAVGNVNLTTLTTGRSTDTTFDDRNYRRTSATTHVGATVQGAGNVVVQAGQDVNLTAAQLSAGNALAVQAGNSINSTAVVDSASLDMAQAGRKSSLAVSASDQTVRGSTFTAGSDIALQAGNDITLQATTVASEQGGIALAAGRDVNLTTASETHSLQVDETKKKSGLLSSKTITTHDKVVDTYAIGTTLSGETVQVAAGRDITTQATQIAGTGDVLLAAGRNIDIGTGENTHTEEHDKSVKQSGLFSGGGAGFTIGTRKTDTTADIEEITHTGSLIGSIEGRVDMVAGGDVTVTGSEVLSGNGIGIVGQNVTIQAAENTLQVTETQKFKQSGINVSLKGGAVDTALAVANSVDRAGEVKDDRLAALHVAKAGQTLFGGGANSGVNSLKNIGNQADDISNAANTGEGTGGSGLSLRIGIGASSSSSKMEYTASTASGSRIASQGDVVIHATGDGQGNGGDLTITGSRVEGDNVALAAARDLLLRSQTETREQVERNKASSGEIGITIGSEAGIGVYVSASMAKGKGDGSGTTHAETSVEAANTLTLISGRDTTLEGAQAKGETVLANVGRNFTLTSQQDTNDYERKDVAAGIDVAVGTGGASVSGYANLSKIDSTYTSVKEQTGIQAGAGGFDLQVGGHTTLTGAAIASTANPALNRLSTQSLSATDLKNEAEYGAMSIGFSASGGSGGGSFSPNIAPPQSDSASSTTRSGISAGTLDIRDGSTAANIDRSVTELQQDGLKEIFDLQEVQEGQEFAAGLSDLATKIVDDIYDAKLADKQAEIDAVQAKADEASANGDTALAGQLYEQVAYMRDKRDAGHAASITKGIVGVAVSALAGNVSLESGLTYSAVNGGVAYVDEAAGRAMRGHDETAAIKITCTKTAQECADIRMPEGVSTEERIEYLRDHGMVVEFIDQIPEGASDIAVNGIVNDQARAGHVQVGHVSRDYDGRSGVTLYVQYNASKGGLSDLMQAGYDKFISPLNNDYSATTQALVDAVLRQGEAGTSLYAHSWGSIVTRNALNLLDDAGYRNPDFTVAVFGPAVRPGALVDPMQSIVGRERIFLTPQQTVDRVQPALTYLSNPADFVATFVGGTLFPSPYLDNNSDQHLPGAAQGQAWNSLRGLPVIIKSPVNPHSCYGLNCAGTQYNWTEERARMWGRTPTPTPASSPPSSAPATAGQPGGGGGE